MFLWKFAAILAFAQFARAMPKANRELFMVFVDSSNCSVGPQYYSETLLDINGTSVSMLASVSSPPIYPSTTSKTTTSTTYSTKTNYATISSTIAHVVAVPYVYPVTVYYTATSYYTTYSTTASTEKDYETFTSYTTSYFASTTTSYPSCSGTLTETTTIMIEAGPTYVLGTTFISAQVIETYYVYGTSTTTDFYTTTTSYFVSGPPHPQVTTAPTLIQTGPHTLTYPCETITVTETQSFEPEIQTAVEIRQTIATTFYSSESYTTTRSTAAHTASTTNTLLFTYTSTYLATAPADILTEVGFNNVSFVTTVSPPTLKVVYATTTTSEITFSTTTSSTFAETFHITAGFGFTSTYLLATTMSTETTSIASKGRSIVSSTTSLTSAITVPTLESAGKISKANICITTLFMVYTLPSLYFLFIVF